MDLWYKKFDILNQFLWEKNKYNIYFQFIYTGRTLTPAILSRTGAITGWESNGPIIGKDLKNWTITAKKSPNKPNIPKLSIKNPKNDLFVKIKNIPNKKQTLPLIFWGLEKK